MQAIRQHEFGGAEVLRLETVDDPVPRPGEVAIAVHDAGVHLLDTSIRAGTGFGSLAPPDLPMIPGREVAGVVDAIGPDTEERWFGQRVVVHLGAASGGYASRAVAPADALFRLPDNVDFAEAVAMVGTGRTAFAILDVAVPRADDVLLVTAAAGGIGSLLVQAGRNAGALVVGAAGGRAKTEIVDRLGADVAVDYADPAWPDHVRDALGDKRITLALDGVGGALGRTAFELVSPGGRMVLFGYASGSLMSLDTADLFATGVTVSAAIGARIAAKPGGIRAYAQEALDALAAGAFHPLVNPPFALADAAAAHRGLESRATTGKVVLVP